MSQERSHGDAEGDLDNSIVEDALLAGAAGRSNVTLSRLSEWFEVRVGPADLTSDRLGVGRTRETTTRVALQSRP